MFKNEVLEDRDSGVRLRILERENIDDVAMVWIIDLNDANSMPRACPVETLQYAIVKALLTPVEGADAPPMLKPSAKAIQRRDKAYEYIAPLISSLDIFRPDLRSQLIQARAKEVGCSPQTLYTYLRSWWHEGQSRNALLPQFHAIGRQTGGTAHRGRPPKYQQRPIYQMSAVDHEAIRTTVEKHYLPHEQVTLAATYQRLLEDHYAYIDGNGNRRLKEPGECPSEIQFRTYVSKTLGIETAIRRRKGDVEFELNHRPKLGSIRTATYTVGDRYEIDATILVVLLVHPEDRSQIVGKPVFYTVRDTKSHLCVGFYVGLESACWIAAMHAIKSISEDKAALCARYGVAFDPLDWPADRVFPKTFVADRGPDMLSNASTQIAEGLEITIENLPTGRADWKPHVEVGFKQIQQTLADVAPGFTPPENIGKRQKRDYSKDAALILHELTAMVLKSIIMQNNTPIESYPLAPKYVLAGMQPTPINIWNAELRDRAGLLTQYSEERVRFALLPRTQATVSRDGIQIGSCFYSAPEAVTQQWFVKAGHGSFKVTVSYDLRLVDTIYVHDPREPNKHFVAHLLEKCSHYRGKSFAEVEALEYRRKVLRQEGKQLQRQLKADFHEVVDKIAADATRASTAASKGKSRSARKKDTAAARSDAKSAQRRDEARIPDEANEHNALGASLPASITPENPATQPSVVTKSLQQRYKDLLDGR